MTSRDGEAIYDDGRSQVAQDEVRRLRDLPDPVTRARTATELLRDYQAAVTELSRIRREAFDDLRRQGLSQTEVAHLVGLSRGRIGQLAASGPAVERGFFGDDDLTAIVAQKQEGGGRPVVAAETLAAVSRLQTLTGALGLAVRVEAVPPPGEVDLNRDNLVVFGGPRVLPVVGHLMQADPFISFRGENIGPWYLHDDTTGQDYRSPQDHGDPGDFGYLARLTRPDGKGTVLVAAGIHPVGLQGVVAMLETDLPELYATVRDSRFSMIVESRYDPTTLEVVEAKPITRPYRHETA